jgi:dihydrodipicolinate reductase
MEKAAHEIPIVYSRNLSVGVSVFMGSSRAAKALGDGYDVEIAEAPPPQEIRRPSGDRTGARRRRAARGRRRGSRGLCSPGP